MPWHAHARPGASVLSQQARCACAWSYTPEWAHTLARGVASAHKSSNCSHTAHTARPAHTHHVRVQIHTGTCTWCSPVLPIAGHPGVQGCCHPPHHPAPAGSHWLTRLSTSTGDTTAVGHSATWPSPPGTPDATTALEKGDADPPHHSQHPRVAPEPPTYYCF